ncbi:Starch-binding associating with outer membrane [Pedobacter steynii]|uniref:Starch-binding associating with outer membrane n=1 Tax=Pedobacter steynii TaxID=430522 RepID=A0A1G9ZDG6_9SPHI|nr:SusD/RagB family nutrient-binding outer membrane lipoprotein [Pedobacter steynii]NQX40022.1 SusD/RagB family nutrient-binding outer membrane lipoprotein [Pedobacter steynii]SDN19167.1 Starch-binding associating with outer membrane [Pedobacter steynii]
MKFNYIPILFSTILALSFSSCKDQLADLNKNPNSAEIPQPDYLLTGAIKSTADTYWGVTNNMNSSLLFIQHWSKIQYTDPDRYIFTNNDLQELWASGYTKGVTNLNKLVSLADEQGNTNYRGVAKVLRSWVFLLLTDAYGDIPYSQSVQINAYVNPVYDAQKEVYFGLLADLKSAQTDLNVAGKPILGDIVYNGKIELWKKFANALRLRIALRIADKEPEKSKSVLAEITSEGGTLIASNLENAQLTYSTSPNQNPVSNLFDTRDDYRISKTIVDRLRSLNDPRLSIFASPTKDVTTETYIGIPNGLLTGDASNYGLTKTSKPGAYFLAPVAPAVIISYAEVLFDRAEVAARGWSNEDAGALYKQAIEVSLQQYGVGTAAIATYTQSAAVQYEPANFRKSIGNQKWIALFGQGLEAFAEWRRLDYPELVPAVAGVLGGKLPLRFIYPGQEQSLNGKNYQQAVARQGADLLTTRLWFDIK